MTILLPRDVVIDDALTSDTLSPQHVLKACPEHPAQPAPLDQSADRIADEFSVPVSPRSHGSQSLYLADSRLAREMSRDGHGDPAPSYTQYVGCALLIMLILIMALGSM